MENYLVIISNNGNHTGRNRVWKLVDQFSSLFEANDRVQEIEDTNEDVNSGLTTCKVVLYNELEELREEGNIVSL